MSLQKKYWILGSLAVLSLSSLIYIKLIGKSFTQEEDQKKNIKKNTHTFSGHPLNVIWAPGSDKLGLYVSGDQKNIDLGLKVGSLLISIKSKFNKSLKYRVLGIKSSELRTTLQLLKDSDFPIDLTFVEQDHLDRQWTQSMLHRVNGRYSFKNGDFEAALKEYRLALDLHPTQKLLHSNKALCLIKLDRFDEALSVCKKMLDIDPLFLKAHYLRAKVCENIGLKATNLERKILYFKHAVTELRIICSKQVNSEDTNEKLKSCLILLKNAKFKCVKDSKVKQEICKNRQRKQLKIFQTLMSKQRKKVEREFEAKTIRYRICEKFISDFKVKEKIWKKVKKMTVEQLNSLLKIQDIVLTKKYFPSNYRGFYGMVNFRTTAKKMSEMIIQDQN